MEAPFGSGPSGSCRDRGGRLLGAFGAVRADRLLKASERKARSFPIRLRENCFGLGVRDWCKRAPCPFISPPRRSAARTEGSFHIVRVGRCDAVGRPL